MFKIKKKNKSQCTLKPMNIIGIKTNMEYRLPMMIFTALMTLITMYCITRIEIDSFGILGDSPAGPYNVIFSRFEVRGFYFLMLAGCALICIANGLKKHSARFTVSFAILYVAYFGIHYKYVANGFVHTINKAIFSVLDERGQKSDIYFLTYFEITDIKLELQYFLMAVIFGTCFLLAFSAVNRCSPLFFTLCVIAYVGLPFVLNCFIGEGFLVCAGIMCILMFVIHFQGYSNFTSKKIFTGFGNSIKIRGRYVSFPAFQQATFFLICTIAVLGVSSIFWDFEDYQKNKSVDNFGRNLAYSVQNITSKNGFGALRNTSSGLNNGDLTRMGDLKYTGEIMFEIRTEPSKYNAPLYLRSFTAANYSNERWTAVTKKNYKKYDFWNEIGGTDFYPQFLFGDASNILHDNNNYTNIFIINKNVNPQIFLSDYRTIPGKTDILESVSAEYDNEISFNSFGGVKDYSQTAAVKGGLSKKNIILDTDILNNNEKKELSLYDLLHDGDFYYSYDHTTNKEFEIFRENEKLYREFVTENYLDYPEGMESYLPDDFDNTIQNLYDSHLYHNENIFLYSYEYSDSDFVSNMYENYNKNLIDLFYNNVIQYVKDWIHGNAEYTLSPGITPQGKELVEYFLMENHKGYCVHFATAATLMLRRAGIPARYVEGYFVSNYDLNRKNAQGYSGIPDSNAHAWTEVYYPLIGWQVVDFTPYYSDEVLPEENKTYNSDYLSTNTETETETDSELKEDSDSDTELDTSNESDTEQSDLISTESDKTVSIPQQESKLKIFLKSALRVIIKVLIFIMAAALIIAVWFIIRFIVLKIRFIRFNSSNRRKAAKVLYLYALLILKINGVVPNQREGDSEFASRAVLKLDGIKTEEFCKLTDVALNARFGKDLPSESDISQMNEIVRKLSDSVYNSSGKFKKIIMKYILFLS